jgi:pilin isopeptide linkage protein
MKKMKKQIAIVAVLSLLITSFAWTPPADTRAESGEGGFTGTSVADETTSGGGITASPDGVPPEPEPEESDGLSGTEQEGGVSLPDSPWEESDFLYDDGRLIGFSAQGVAKLNAANAGGEAVTLDIPYTAGFDAIADGAFAGHAFQNLAVGEGYTRIGDGAFQNCGLESVELPDTLETLGAYAFAGNEIGAVDFADTALEFIGASAFRDNRLKALTLPASATNIEDGAFMNNRLASVELPGVVSVGENAFSGNRLSEVSLPASVTDIAKSAFSGNGRVVKIITESKDLDRSFVAGNSCVVNPVTIRVLCEDEAGTRIGERTVGDDYKRDKLYPAGIETTIEAPVLTGYVARESEKTVPAEDVKAGLEITFVYETANKEPVIYAYDKVVDPDSYGGMMTREDLLMGVTAVSSADGSDITANLGCKPESVDTTEAGTTTVLYSVFDKYGNEAQKTVNIIVAADIMGDFLPGQTVWTYEDFTYDGNTLTGFSASGVGKYTLNAQKDLVLPGINPSEKGKTLPIKTISGLAEAPSESYVNDAGGPFGIGEFTSVDFRLCRDLETIESYAFCNARPQTLDFGECAALREVGYRAFYGNYSNRNAHRLNTLSFKGCSSLETVGEQAFYYPYNLTTLDFSGCSSLTTIGEQAFYYAYNLKTLDFSDCANLVSIGDGAFYYNPGNLKTLNFKGCYSLKEIGNEAFYHTDSIATLDFSDCANLVSIGDKAFYNALGLKTLNLTGCSSLRTIGKSAFEYSWNLPALDLSDCAKLETIGDKAFYYVGYYGGVTALDLSGLLFLDTIGEQAFYSAGNLTALDFSGSSLRVIGKEAFQYCSSLRTIDFSGCTKLETIGSLDNSQSVFYSYYITDINFSGCTSLRTIGSYAFAYCRNLLTDIDLSDCSSLETIGNYAFKDAASDYNANPIELDLSGCAKLVTIGEEAFNNAKLRNRTLDFSGCSSLETIGRNSFYPASGSVGITTLDFSGCSSLAVIGVNVFSDFKQLTKLDLSGCSSLETIGANTFSGAKLTELDLSDCSALEVIERSAFSGSLLTELDISGCTGLTTIEDYAFGNSKLTELDLSGCANLTTIGSSAFYNSPLTELDLSGCPALKTIDSGAFRGAKLTTLDLSRHTNLEKIGDGAFYDSPLESITVGRISNTSGNIYNGWGSSVTGSNPKLPIYILDNTGDNPVRTATGYLVNPVDVTVHYVEKENHANVLKESAVVRVSSDAGAFLIPKAFVPGYVAVPLEVSFTPEEMAAMMAVSVPPTAEAYMEFLELDASILEAYNVFNLVQTGIVTEGLIGRPGSWTGVGDRLSTSVRLNSSGTIPSTGSNWKIAVYYDNTRVRYDGTENPPAGWTVDSSAPGVVYLTKTGAMGSGDSVEAPLYWRFVRDGSAEEGRPFALDARLIALVNFGSGVSEETAVAVADPVTLKGKYEAHGLGITVYSPGNEVNGNEVTVETADGAESADVSLRYNFSNSIHRNLETYTLKVTLPLYDALTDEGTERRRAAFDSEKNPGWAVSETDPNVLIFKLEGINTYYISVPPLTLDFEDAKEGIINCYASFTAEPYGKWESEKDIYCAGEARMTLITEKSEEEEEEGEPGKLWLNLWPETANFWNTRTGRASEFGWILQWGGLDVSSRCDAKLLLDDLDPRMKYTGLDLKSHENADVFAKDADGNVLYASYGASGRVNFPADLADKIKSIEINIENQNMKKHPVVAAGVYTRLRDADTPLNLYENPEVAYFYGRASILYLKEYKADGVSEERPSEEWPDSPVISDRDRVIARDMEQSARVTQSVADRKYAVGEEVRYALSVEKYANGRLAGEKDGFDAAPNNFRVIDVLPAGLNFEGFTPSESLINAAGGRDKLNILYDDAAHTLTVSADTFDLAEAGKEIAIYNPVTGRLETMISPSGAFGELLCVTNALATVSEKHKNSVYTAFEGEDAAVFGPFAQEAENPFTDVDAGKVGKAETEITLGAWKVFTSDMYQKPGDGYWRKAFMEVGSEDPIEYIVNVVNATDQTYENADIVDILPRAGVLGSTFGVTLTGVEYSGKSNGTLQYTTDNINGRDGIKDAAWTDWTDSQPNADTMKSVTALRVTGAKLDAGKTLSLTLEGKVQYLDDDALAGKSAYNTAYVRYSAAAPAESPASESIQTVQSALSALFMPLGGEDDGGTYQEIGSLEAKLKDLPAFVSVEKKDLNDAFLSGAEFELRKADNGEAVARGSTDKDGKLTLSGFSRGNFVLYETKAPAGYKKSESSVATIDAGGFKLETRTVEEVATKGYYLGNAISVVNDFAEKKAGFRIFNVLETGAKGEDEKPVQLPIKGAEFKISSYNSSVGVTHTVKTDDEGYIYLTDILPLYQRTDQISWGYNKYYIFQTSVPGNLVPHGSSTQLGTIELSATGGITLTPGYNMGEVISHPDKETGGKTVKVVNKRVSATLKMITVKSETLISMDRTILSSTDGVAVPDMKFKLYDMSGETPGDGTEVGSEQSTAKPGSDLGSGKIKYDNLTAGVLYRAKQTGLPPEDYKHDTLGKNTYFYFDSDGALHLSDADGADNGKFNAGMVMVRNIPIPGEGTLTVTKFGKTLAPGGAAVPEEPDAGEPDAGEPVPGTKFLIEKSVSVEGGESVWAPYLPGPADLTTGTKIESEPGTFVTSAAEGENKGKIVLKNLGAGFYRVKELPSDIPYTTDPYIFTFQVKQFGAGQKFDHTWHGVSIVPEVVKGRLVGTFDTRYADGIAELENAKDALKKAGGHPREIFAGINKIELLDGLAGAEYKLEIYDGDNKQVGGAIALISDDDGDLNPKQAENETPVDFAGLFKSAYTYKFIETKAPAGYELSHEVYVYRPGEEGPAITLAGGKQIALKDLRITHDIVLSKYASDTLKPLKGATFSLLDKDEKPAVDADEKTVEAQTSDANGAIRFTNLANGIYYLKETAAPTGYKLPKNEYVRFVLQGETTDGLKPAWPVDGYSDEVDKNGNTIIDTEPEQADGHAVLYNNPTAYDDSLTIEKKLYGKDNTEVTALTDPKSESFDFKVTYGGNDENTYKGPYTLFLSPADTVGNTRSTAADGLIKLQGGQKAVIYGIAKGTHFTVTEIPKIAEKYAISAKGPAKKDTFKETTTGAGILAGKMQVTFKNVPARYTVTYKKGSSGKFPKQRTPNLFYEDATPEFPAKFVDENTGKPLGRPGNSFTGWALEGSTEIQEPAAMVTRSAIYVAQWAPILYTVTYKDGEGENAHGAKDSEQFPQTHESLSYKADTPEFEVGERPNRAPGNPQGEPGWEFTGWTPKWVKTVKENATYTAQWKQLKYTVTYEKGAQGTFKTQRTKNLVYGDDTPAFNGSRDDAGDPLGKPGNKFTGWKLNNAGDTLNDPITAKVTRSAIYVAQWEPILYTVTYDPGDEGKFKAEDYTTPGLTYKAETPDFEADLKGDLTDCTEGYEFTGWAVAGEAIKKPAAKVTKDVTYVAQWKPILYTVTYKDGDGDDKHGADPAQLPQTYDGLTYGTETPVFRVKGEPGVPTGEPGYEFTGWEALDGGDLERILPLGGRSAPAETVTGDATYVAKWVYNAEPATVVLRAVKTANVPMKAGLFEFALCESDADGKQGKEIETQTNGAGSESAVVFDAISYGESGTWLYLMREKQTNLSGWTTDNAQYLIRVSVSDDGKGQHVAVVSVKNGEEWVPYVPYAGTGTADAASLRFANVYASQTGSPSPPEKPEPEPTPAPAPAPEPKPEPAPEPAPEPEPVPKHPDPPVAGGWTAETLEDGSVLITGPDKRPLGTYRYEDGGWIWEEYVPDSGLPQTGTAVLADDVSKRAPLVLVLALLLALAAGVILRRRFTHTQKP